MEEYLMLITRRLALAAVFLAAGVTGATAQTVWNLPTTRIRKIS
jgi:hypothetical protein